MHFLADDARFARQFTDLAGKLVRHALAVIRKQLADGIRIVGDGGLEFFIVEYQLAALAQGHASAGQDGSGHARAGGAQHLLHLRTHLAQGRIGLQIALLQALQLAVELIVGRDEAGHVAGDLAAVLGDDEVRRACFLQFDGGALDGRRQGIRGALDVLAVDGEQRILRGGRLLQALAGTGRIAEQVADGRVAGHADAHAAVGAALAVQGQRIAIRTLHHAGVDALLLERGGDAVEAIVAAVDRQRNDLAAAGGKLLAVGRAHFDLDQRGRPRADRRARGFLRAADQCLSLCQLLDVQCIAAADSLVGGGGAQHILAAGGGRSGQAAAGHVLGHSLEFRQRRLQLAQARELGLVARQAGIELDDARVLRLHLALHLRIHIGRDIALRRLLRTVGVSLAIDGRIKHGGHSRRV